MGIELGHISAIFRYPIKSMAGEGLIPQKSAGMASKAIGSWRFDVLPIAARSPG
jgi:hypothetical protein